MPRKKTITHTNKAKREYIDRWSSHFDEMSQLVLVIPDNVGVDFVVWLKKQKAEFNVWLKLAADEIYGIDD